MRTGTRLVWSVVAVLMVLASLTRAEPVVIGGVSYDYVDPGEPFTQRAEPVPSWELPKPSRAERAAGFMLYVTSDPGEVRPDGRPKASQRRRALHTFLAKGEDEPLCFAIYALDDISGLMVEADTTTSGCETDVRYMHFWPQRTGWRSRQWYMTPELLLPCADGSRSVPVSRGVLKEQPFDVPAGQTAAFWLTLSSKADAQAGVHNDRIVIRAAGRPPLVVPHKTEILPLQLTRPPQRSWLLYADVARWQKMGDEQVMAELRDFARHGMNGLVELPLGKADLSGLRKGKVTYDATPFRKLATMCETAGLAGPHVAPLGGMAYRVRDALGLTCDVRTEPWPDALKKGMSRVAAAAVKATADIDADWYFYGVDEPKGDNLYAIQEYECWRQGGARTYATFYQLGFLEQASRFLTAPCFMAGLIAHESRSRQALDGCRAGGSEFWWYGTGSYVNPAPQEGLVFPNRYGAGYLFWKSQARGQVTWTFCRPHEDVFNDFDGSRVNGAEPKEQATAYPHFLEADNWSTYQGAIPTIAWESLREGVDDYSYLYMAQQAIEAARREGGVAGAKAADAAQRTLDSLLASVPWVNPLGWERMDTARLQQVRRVAADIAVRLSAIAAGNPASSTGHGRTQRIRISLEAREAQADSATELRVLPVPPTAIAPAIDGDLGDSCWEAAAVATPFLDARNAGPTAMASTARILHDANGVYVSFRCAETKLAQLSPVAKGRDPDGIWLEDSVEFFLAGSDPANYLHLIVNPQGALYDEHRQNPAWNGNLKVAAGRQPDAWTVEIFLPWQDVTAAGLVRGPLLRANFCRNRYLDGDQYPHSAWSPTFGGFHQPTYFGSLTLQTGSVVLSQLHVPGLWGKQNLVAALRNTSGKMHRVRIALRGEAAQEHSVPPRTELRVNLPVDLTTPGPWRSTLEWSVAGEPSHRLAVATDVPPPIQLLEHAWFVGPRDTAFVPVQINLPAAMASHCRIAVTAGDSARPIASIRAQPGKKDRARLRTPGTQEIRVSLRDRETGAVLHAETGHIFLVPTP
jgi:hypothetical protein